MVILRIIPFMKVEEVLISGRLVLAHIQRPVILCLVVSLLVPILIML